ncbi:HGGxSTG domain-containing protein [Methylovulum psychrotolerans]|uniref:HGGxSTG domain-containing protein n=1 Tax=Methylovulum psychrotolerans TaxID=1704499 RepID=UPI000CDEC09D
MGNDAALCGAKKANGEPCRSKAVYRNGRCKFHGGLSTGPKTAEGKAKSALNGLCPKQRHVTAR